MKYETQESSWLGLLTHITSEVVADVAAVILYAAIASTVILSLPPGSTVRALVALPLVFFFPGYAIVAALYPGRSVRAEELGASRLNLFNQSLRGMRLGWQTRLALAVGISVAILPVLAVALSLVGIQPSPLIRTLVLDAVLFVGMLVALWRRYKLAERDRFRVPYRAWLDRLSSVVHNQPMSSQLFIVALLLLSIVSVVGLGSALVTDQSAESYTNFMVLTESDGEFVAGDYPTELTAGETESFVVKVANHERQQYSYTVVPVVQRVEPGGETVTVREQTQLESFRAQVQPGETQYVSHEVSPSMQGESIRLVYLLYRGDAPANPTIESSYRHVHLWLNVSGQN
jgi:uncharacterized membrane protein